jgi:hypothetical protein
MRTLQSMPPLRSLLPDNGAPTKTFPAFLEIKNTNPNFFLQVTSESVELYDIHVFKAVRCQDVTVLRQLLQSGRSHLYIRRVDEEVLQYCNCVAGSGGQLSRHLRLRTHTVARCLLDEYAKL